MNSWIACCRRSNISVKRGGQVPSALCAAASASSISPASGVIGLRRSCAAMAINRPVHGPLFSDNQDGGAAAENARGGGRWSKSPRQDLEQVSIRKTNESEPIEDASLQTLDVAETRGDELFWDKSVGSLMTGQTVTGVERA